MSKTNLIIRREYLTRVRKKSFIIMSVLGPVLFATLMIIPGWLMSLESKDVRTIAVVEYNTSNQPVPDSQMIFKDVLPGNEFLRFSYIPSTRLETLRDNFEDMGYYAVLFIPQNITYAKQARLYSTKQPSLEVKDHIEGAIENYLYNLNLRKYDISLDVINRAKININVETIKWTETGEQKSSAGLSMVVGYAGGFLVYILIFAFGAQVMRGIIDEKTNRIVEVIITSVRPFQLMSGKIIGIALVGLTQITLWFILTFAIVQGIESYVYNQKIPSVEELQPADVFNSEMGKDQSEQAKTETSSELPAEIANLDDILVKIKSLNYPKILLTFFFFFLGGYLLYAAMFAAVGSAIDTDTDTQQFMLPITIPLILSLVTMGYVLNSPESGLAFWLSMIPFTSPIIMMARIPFEIPVWQIYLSGFILFLTFVLMTGLSAKIYRTGILMYGKKASYKELWKWLFYKR